MSFQMESRGGGEGQDFDLNLAPVIDCFTVLITFMLASAAFLSVGILDAGVAASGVPGAANAVAQPVNIAVELGARHAMVLRVTGKTSSTSAISATGDDWNYDELGKKLSELRGRWPSVSSVTLSAQNQVPYLDVIRTLESIRKTMPVVLLGGF